jgi:hypothetical protein
LPIYRKDKTTQMAQSVSDSVAPTGRRFRRIADIDGPEPIDVVVVNDPKPM